MRFLDANIFIYAYYKPRGPLTDKEKYMKEEAKRIINKINNGEEIITTVVHLSEISNILKKALGLTALQELLLGLYSFSNVAIVDVSADDYLAAIDSINITKVDSNDCLAIEIMNKNNIAEIYSFDSGFDSVEGITRLP